MSKENGSKPAKTKDFLNDLQPVQLDMFRARIGQLAEAGSYGTDDAPWSPVPLGDAREYLNEDETRKLDMIFPTVYEEDRSIKLKDIAMIQGLNYASHRWASEQAAQELGREDFDYDQEMKAIKKEEVLLPKPAVLPGEEPGAVPGEPGKPGHAVLGQGAWVQGDPTGGEFDPAGSEHTPDAVGKRDQVSNVVQAEFRRQQRQSTRAFKRIGIALGQFTETMRAMANTIREVSKVPASLEVQAAPPAEQKIEVHSPPVHVYLPESQVPAAPNVTVHQPATKLRAFKVTERDEHGMIKTLQEVETPPENADGAADPH